MFSEPIHQLLIFLVALPVALLCAEKCIKKLIWEPETRRYLKLAYKCYQIGQGGVDSRECKRILRYYVFYYIRDQVNIWYSPFPIGIFFYISQNATDRYLGSCFMIITFAILLISFSCGGILCKMRKKYEDAFEEETIKVLYVNNTIKDNDKLVELPQGESSWLLRKPVLILKTIRVYTFSLVIGAPIILLAVASNFMLAIIAGAIILFLSYAVLSD